MSTRKFSRAAALAAALCAAALAPGAALADVFLTVPAAAGPQAPGNDNFANALNVPFAAGTRVAAAGTNAGATREAAEPRHRALADTTTVWFRFQAGANGTMTIDTHGSQIDTVLAVYTGASLSTLTRVRLNDDFERTNPFLFRTSRVSFPIVDGTTYHVVVAGKKGAEGSYRIWFTPPGVPFH